MSFKYLHRSSAMHSLRQRHLQYSTTHHLRSTAPSATEGIHVRWTWRGATDYGSLLLNLVRISPSQRLASATSQCPFPRGQAVKPWPAQHSRVVAQGILEDTVIITYIFRMCGPLMRSHDNDYIPETHMYTAISKSHSTKIQLSKGYK